MRDRLPVIGFAVIIAFAVFNVFGPVLQADFVMWDDDINIYKNPHFGGLNASRLAWMFTDFSYSRVYNPLAWLMWGAVYECFGLDPFGFHLLNLSLHSVNAALVFLVLRKTLRLLASATNGMVGGYAFEWSSAIAAVIWAVHPLQVEPVAWATAIGYVQGLFFLLLSVLAFLHANESNRRGLRWLALGGFTASLLTYPVALGAPVIFIAIHWLQQRKRQTAEPANWGFGSLGSSVAVGAPFLLVSFAVFGITLFARETMPSFWKPPPTLQEFGLLERAAQAFYGWAYYLWRPFWPVELSPYYTSLLNVNPTTWPFLSAAGLVAGLSILVISKLRRWPVIAAAWFCYLSLLLPLLGFFEHPHFTNDRYFYLVSVIPAALLAAGLLKLSDIISTRATGGPSIRLVQGALGFPRGSSSRLKNLALSTGFFGLAVILGLTAHRQTSKWQSSETLFTHVIAMLKDHPSRENFWVRLGSYYGERGEFSAAEGAFRNAVAIAPDAPVSHYLLGRALAAQGKFEEAVSVFASVLNARPDFNDARIALARVFAELNHANEAAALFEAALEREPGNQEVHIAYAKLLAKEGTNREAIRKRIQSQSPRTTYLEQPPENENRSQ